MGVGTRLDTGWIQALVTSRRRIERFEQETLDGAELVHPPEPCAATVTLEVSLYPN